MPHADDALPHQQSTEQSGTQRDIEEEADVASAAGSSEDTVRTITGFRWLLVCVSLYVSAFPLRTGHDHRRRCPGFSYRNPSGTSSSSPGSGAGFSHGLRVRDSTFLTGILNSFNMKWTYVASVLVFEIGLCRLAVRSPA